MTLLDVPKVKVEWRFTLGSLFNAGLIVAGFIWAASAFTAKTQADGVNEKDLATALKTRIELIDVRTAAQDNRLIAVETSLVFIREILTRIEQNGRKQN